MTKCVLVDWYSETESNVSKSFALMSKLTLTPLSFFRNKIFKGVITILPSLYQPSLQKFYIFYTPVDSASKDLQNWCFRLLILLT